MEIFKLAILSVIQGITELLPISSSGHLLLTSSLLNIELDNLLLTVLHIGTTLAIILFLRKTLFKNIFTKKKLTFYLKILVASIPAGIVGISLSSFIENQLRASWIIGVSLIVWGIAMVIVEQTKKESKVEKKIDLETISWKQSILIGIGQTLALIPGTSRSGITTLVGIYTGLDKYTAFEYSFVLGIPVLLGASILEITKAYFKMEIITSEILLASGIRMLPIILISFVIGYLALVLVRKNKKRNWLTVFGIYRILLGIVVILFF